MLLPSLCIYEQFLVQCVSHEQINSGKISHIIYNGWWPGSNDPVYLLNQADNTTRINYYGVSSVPWIDVNGTTISSLPQVAVELNASGLSSGIYFYKLQSSGSVLVKEMMVLK